MASIRSKRLDGLMFQFSATTLEFFNQYISARSIVDSPGGHKANGQDAPSTNGGDTPKNS